MSRRLFVLTWLVILAPAFRAQSQEAAESGTAGIPSEFKSAEFKPEARVAIAQGIQFLENKQPKQAINAFTAAARMHPENGQFRHLLGFAYAQDKQLGPAWLQFRKAVIFNPGYAPAVRDFISLWTAFDNKGVLSVGRPQEQIAKMLGEPDTKQGDPQHEIWQYGFMRLQFLAGRLASIIDPRGLDSATTKPLDVMKIEFDDKNRWQLGNRAVDRLQAVTEYVPRQQTVRDWKELYTVQRIYNTRGQNTPRKMMLNMEKELKKIDPQTNFVVLADNEHDVLFHWSRRGSNKQAAEHEIARLVMGQRDIHRVAYTRKVAQIPQAEAQMWLGLLRRATLTSPAQASASTN